MTHLGVSYINPSCNTPTLFLLLNELPLVPVSVPTLAFVLVLVLIVLDKYQLHGVRKCIASIKANNQLNNSNTGALYLLRDEINCLLTENIKLRAENNVLRLVAHQTLPPLPDRSKSSNHVVKRVSFSGVDLEELS